MGQLGCQVWQWVSLSAESSYGPSLLNLLNMKIASFLHPDLKRYRVIDTALVKTHKCDCQGALHPYCRCALSCFPFGFLPKQLMRLLTWLHSGLFWDSFLSFSQGSGFTGVESLGERVLLGQLVAVLGCVSPLLIRLG